MQIIFFAQTSNGVKNLLLNIISAGLGFWLAVMFVPGVSIFLYPDSNFFGISLTASWQIFLILGIILGLLNYFIKPILNVLSLPLQIITLGLFSLVINLALIYTVDIIFRELSIVLWLPLLYTGLIIWGLNIVLSQLTKENS